MLHIFDEEKKGKLDFMDLLIKAAELVGSHRRVRDALKKRFRYVLVDEFQDTDPIQAYLCGFLCERQETHAQTLIDVELEAGNSLSWGTQGSLSTVSAGQIPRFTPP